MKTYSTPMCCDNVLVENCIKLNIKDYAKPVCNVYCLFICLVTMGCNFVK